MRYYEETMYINYALDECEIIMSRLSIAIEIKGAQLLGKSIDKDVSDSKFGKKSSILKID